MTPRVNKHGYYAYTMAHLTELPTSTQHRFGQTLPRIDHAIKARNWPRLETLLRQTPLVQRCDNIRGALEASADNIPIEAIRVFIKVEPRTLADDTVSLLLNSGHLEGVEYLYKAGWVPIQAVADEIAECIASAIECDRDDPGPIDLQTYYAPIIGWLQDKGLVVVPRVGW